jgi:formate/nitrite transporter FocA (FNT family)
MDDDVQKIVLPDGQTASRQDQVATERSKERTHEDDQFVPVILKRSDEVRRHPDDALEHAIEEGLEQLNRPAVSLLLSSVAAGLILGFSAMAVAVVFVATAGLESALIPRLLTAAVYPLGFVLCIMSGAQLYTEHTATAVYPLLDGKAGWSRLLRLWFIVIVGNLIGAALGAGLLTMVDDVTGAREGYVEIGQHLVGFRFVPLLISALLAGWLMALGAWLVISAPPDLSQFASIYIVTFLIGLGGLHHSIAGSAEIFAAFFISDEFTVAQSARFIGVALMGNSIGGTVFVAILNYAHIRKTQESPEGVNQS